jgi:RNA methyltransferase, TrmH family
VVASALAAAIDVEGLYVAQERRGAPQVTALVERCGEAGIPVFELAPGLLDRVASTVTPQPVVAVAPLVERDLAVLGDASLVVVGVGIADPGNAGTIVRVADAAGVGAVVLTGDAVDPFNPKAVRSSAGSIFHIPVAVAAQVSVVLGALTGRGLRCLASVAQGGTDYAAVDWSVPTAILLGNEAGGLPPAVLEAADAAVGIPMRGRAESLNVASACAVLCFEAQRQRRSSGPGPSTMPG